MGIDSDSAGAGVSDVPTDRRGNAVDVKPVFAGGDREEVIATAESPGLCPGEAFSVIAEVALSWTEVSTAILSL